MRQLFTFVRKEWFHIWRDPRTLVILFGLPIVQILIFGFALTNEVKNSQLAVLDLAHDELSERIAQRLEASAYFDLNRELRSYRDIEAAFRAGRVKLVAVFPEGFAQQLRHGSSAPVQLIADASDPNIATTLVTYATAILSDASRELSPQLKLPLQIVPEVRMLYNPQLEGAYTFVPGVMAMVLMLVCTMMTSIAIVREKEMGTMEVLLVSPMRPIVVILAKMVPYLALSLVNITSILVLSYFVLHLPIRGSLVLLVSLSVLFTITCLSLGLLISSLTSSQQIAMMISLVGLFLPTLMLSGFMFPIENMPAFLQVVSHAVPARWYFSIVKDVMLKGLGLLAIWKEAAILGAMTLGLVAVSLRKFQRRLEG